MPVRTVPELLEHVSSFDKPFFIYQGEAVTYREFDRITDEIATAFLRMGLKKGDRVGIIALNQPEWLYTFFAANKVGIGVVALNVRYREAELEYMLNNSSAKALVSLPELDGFSYVEFFEKNKERFPELQHLIYIGSTGSGSGTPFESLLGEVDERLIEQAESEVEEQDTSVIIYTSGTTGKPKGANITHKSILSSSRALGEHMRNSEEDIILGHMPLNHVGGISCSILSAVHFGATVILIPSFVPELVLDAIQRYKATIFAGVPTMYLMLFNSSFEKYDVSSLRLVVIGGSNAQPELLKRIRAGFPNATVMNLYGLTESSGACICSPLDDSFDDMLDSIGVPIGDYEVMIVDENGQPLPDGEVGEIAIKGDCVCNGYIGLEEKTRESFRNGWLFTGDMAYKRGNRVYFMGRKKEMYIQAGYNVYPAEIENVLIKHPKVFMVAVIGVPDDFYGEKGVAYVVPKGEVSQEELKEYCARYLADYKVPKEFIFEESLPLTPAGKIQKSELLRMYVERKGS